MKNHTNEKNSKFWIRLLCWILAGLMLLGVATTMLAAIVGML